MVEGSDAGDFVPVDPPSAVSIGPPVGLRLKFSPVSVGTKEARLVLKSSNGPISIVELGGSASNACLEVLGGDRLDFGAIAITKTSDSKSISLRNCGLFDVAGIAAVTNKPFGLTASPPSGLHPGQTGELDVRFTPERVEPSAAALTIISDSSKDPIKVPLKGSGVLACLNLEPGRTLDFGKLKRKAKPLSKSILVKNCSSVPVSIDHISLKSNDLHAFSLASSPEGSLAPRAQQTIVVTFSAVSRKIARSVLRISTDPRVDTPDITLLGQRKKFLGIF